MTNIEDMTRMQLIREVVYLRERVAQLENKVTDMGWELNPDRMGGQFTREETERNWDGWT